MPLPKQLKNKVIIFKIKAQKNNTFKKNLNTNLKKKTINKRKKLKEKNQKPTI